MDAIFMNSRNGKTIDPRRLLLNLTDKVNLKRSDKYVALSNLYYTWKKFKSHTKIIYLKYQLQNGEKSVNYLTDDIEYYFEYILKKQGEKTDNPSIRI